MVVTKDNLEEFLGRSRYTYQKVNEKDEIGIVRGLAWTSVGGDTLQIEVNLMPGKGEFLLTGQLGDVMKESAQAGISYIRSVADQYAIKPEFFKEHDLHIHIPEGAVPKDGPSAGITMATAMLSAITGRAVRANLAMTGEITLRGRVRPDRWSERENAGSEKCRYHKDFSAGSEPSGCGRDRCGDQRRSYHCICRKDGAGAERSAGVEGESYDYKECISGYRVRYHQ